MTEYFKKYIYTESEYDSIDFGRTSKEQMYLKDERALSAWFRKGNNEQYYKLVPVSLEEIEQIVKEYKEKEESERQIKEREKDLKEYELLKIKLGIK